MRIHTSNFITIILIITTILSSIESLVVNTQMHTLSKGNVSSRYHWCKPQSVTIWYISGGMNLPQSWIKCTLDISRSFFGRTHERHGRLASYGVSFVSTKYERSFTSRIVRPYALSCCIWPRYIQSMQTSFSIQTVYPYWKRTIFIYHKLKAALRLVILISV